jgi:quercetin dioxygenase-like cupin family protein
MRHLLTASFAALACALAHPATAQPEERGVPILQAPYHLPAFRNEFITLLNVTVPPGRNTGYHIHSTDSVSVNVEAADMTNQNLGDAQAGPPRHSRRGEASFTMYTGKPPRTHKASNVGATPFHNISFLFAYPNPGRFTPAARPEGTGYKEIMDNERVRAWRLTLEPGQIATAITQAAPGLRIVIDPGEIAEIVPGQPDRGMLLKNGDYFWQDAGVTRAVRNIGTTRVEYLEFELK